MAQQQSRISDKKIKEFIPETLPPSLDLSSESYTALSRASRKLGESMM